MSEPELSQRAYSAALRFLSYRPRSEAELRSRLRRRFSPAVVDQVVKILKEHDIVDDIRFARAWTESRDSFKPRSALAVKRELRAKGVSSGIAEDAVKGIDDDDNAYRAGLSQARKLEGAGLDTFRRRLWGYLKRRGFGDSVSRRTIMRLWDEAGGSR